MRDTSCGNVVEKRLKCPGPGRQLHDAHRVRVLVAMDQNLVFVALRHTRLVHEATPEENGAHLVQGIVVFE